MHHSTQKRKLTEHLDIIYIILRENKNDNGKSFIKSTPYEFKKKWIYNSYCNGVNKIGIDLLYSIITYNMERIKGIQKRIMIDFAGDIEAFLQSDSYIIGKYKKSQIGLSGFTCMMLEKLQKNKMDFFDDLYNQLQEKK